jgi:hypothetical protein
LGISAQNFIFNILIHSIILSRMELLLSLLPFTTCFGRKRPIFRCVRPQLFHCSLIHITCNCDISWFKI